MGEMYSTACLFHVNLLSTSNRCFICNKVRNWLKMLSLSIIPDKVTSWAELLLWQHFIHAIVFRDIRTNKSHVKYVCWHSLHPKLQVEIQISFSFILLLLLFFVVVFFFKQKVFFLFLLGNIYCGYSLEALHRGSSNEYPQNVFFLCVFFFFFYFFFGGGGGGGGGNKKNICWKYKYASNLELCMQY